jgi:hypothetical protein
MTFASLIDATGIVAASALIFSFVQVLKGASPFLSARVSGALMAFVSSAVLYVIAAIVLPSGGPDNYLQVFAAWVAVAGLAMGIKAGADHVDAVRSGTAGPVIASFPSTEPSP